MKLVLDTNVYCDYAEGLPSAVDFLAIHGEEEFFLPSFVNGELTYAIMKQNLVFLTRFCEVIAKSLAAYIR